ncbi:carbohydrate sulfotransferase 10-like [Anneissia japonica]|uniref:carbohydrate sulfotransferase 10-like n=1 Tax=Anneissia japonica TaxID=1529436 RepID=UPI00142563A3|nr:carbohydrate sulfotransferase 10-like [Anneissia japonica]
MYHYLRFEFFVISLAGVVCLLYYSSNLTENTNTNTLLFRAHSNTIIPGPISFKDSYVEKEKRNTSSWWIIKQEEIQRQRLALLKKECKSTHYKRNAHVPVKLFIELSHNLMYCPIPKIASSSWKHMLLILGGCLNADEQLEQHLMSKHAQNCLPMFTFNGLFQQNNEMDSYIKFLYVRHPFSRVLSAFKNKLDPKTTLKNAGFWQRKFGMNIIRKYRTNKEFYRIKANFKRNYNLKFGEFVKYIGDPKVSRNVSTDNHWIEVFNKCDPCSFHYNFIGKMETMAADTDYLMMISKIDKEFEFPSSTLSSPTNSSGRDTVESYYKDLPVQDLKNLYNRYKLDFKLFGYPKPDFENGNIIRFGT